MVSEANTIDKQELEVAKEIIHKFVDLLGILEKIAFGEVITEEELLELGERVSEMLKEYKVDHPEAVDIAKQIIDREWRKIVWKQSEI